MLFKLTDGREVDLGRIVDVSTLRDSGVDPTSISMSKIGFHIRMKDGLSIVVERKYHYADWAKAKKELDEERKALLCAREEAKAKGAL